MIWWFMAVFNHPAGFQPNLNHGAFCSNGDFLCGDLLVLHRQKVSWRVADFPYLVLQGLFFRIHERTIFQFNFPQIGAP